MQKIVKPLGLGKAIYPSFSAVGKRADLAVAGGDGAMKIRPFGLGSASGGGVCSITSFRRGNACETVCRRRVL